MITEEQWMSINQYGFDKIKKVLIMVGKGKPFPLAFQRVYNNLY
jgi:hypothetical protein